jgi:hypothetical protein
MNIFTKNNKKSVAGVVAFLLLALVSFPVLADTPTPETDSEDTLDNAIYMPIVPFGPKSSVEPTPTPSADPTKSPTPIPPGYPTGDTTYYISPTGNDGRSGLSAAEAWATFDRAWKSMDPGDTLILMDGVYKQSLNPRGGGVEGKPITIKAQHDGKAIIDGEGIRDPVTLWTYRDASYFIIEGIVAKNGNLLDGNGNVIKITTDHNILRRISAYDANPDENSAVIRLSGHHNLIEDCVAAGTARKLIALGLENNTVRRCFTRWTGWDGRDFCGNVTWPNAQSIQIYHGEHNIIENSITVGPVPNYHISIQANDPRSTLIDNQVLGSIAIGAGVKLDGSLKFWGPGQVDPVSRPTPTECSQNLLWTSEQIGQRSGFDIHGSGVVKDNLFKDIFSYGNAGLGLAADGLTGDIANNRIDHATIKGNGVDNPDRFGGLGVDVDQDELSKFVSIQNSFMETIYTGSGTITMTGEGARLTHRYVDGVLTNSPLWPWPMEDRIQAELGISVTEWMTSLIFGTSDLSEIYK